MATDTINLAEGLGVADKATLEGVINASESAGLGDSLIVQAMLASGSSSVGGTSYSVLWPNNTTGVLIKAGMTHILGYLLGNTASSIRYVKLYDLARIPRAGSDVPAWRIALPATTTITFNVGLEFYQGLGITVSTGAADTDNTAPSANDVIVNLIYH